MKPGAKPGQRFGGRSKGTPNKKTDEIRRLIQEACGADWDPVQAMALAAKRGGFEVWDPATNAPAVDPVTGLPVLQPIGDKTRASLHKEVSEYLHPKRRALEVTGEDGGPISFGIGVEFVEPSGE